MILMYLLVGFLVVYVSSYLVLGPISWRRALRTGLFPGPLILESQPDATGVDIDWLLLHGARLDARVFCQVLQNNPDRRLVAISLGGHQKGPHLADPVSLPAQEICRFLEDHRIAQGVVGYSTAVFWMAEAYHRRPELWQELRVILVAPNLGIGHKQSRYHAAIPVFSWLFPDPYWSFWPMKACQGVDKASYKRCRWEHCHGSILNIASVSYYRKVLGMMTASTNQASVQEFLTAMGDRLEVYIAANDIIMDPQIYAKLVHELNIAHQIVPGVSHLGILEHWATWLPASSDKKATG